LEALVKHRSDAVRFACAIPVGPPPRGLTLLAPYLALPPLLVGLFVLNQCLRRRAHPSFLQD